MRRQSFFTESFHSSEKSKVAANASRFKLLVLDSRPDADTYFNIWKECLNMLCERAQVEHVANKYFDNTYKWSTILVKLYNDYLPKYGIFRSDLANLNLDDTLCEKVAKTFGTGSAYFNGGKRAGNYLFAYFDEECYVAVNKAFYAMLLDEVEKCS